MYRKLQTKLIKKSIKMYSTRCFSPFNCDVFLSPTNYRDCDDVDDVSGVVLIDEEASLKSTPPTSSSFKAA